MNDDLKGVLIIASLTLLPVAVVLSLWFSTPAGVQPAAVRNCAYDAVTRGAEAADAFRRCGDWDRIAWGGR